MAGHTCIITNVYIYGCIYTVPRIISVLKINNNKLIYSYCYIEYCITIAPVLSQMGAGHAIT